MVQSRTKLGRVVLAAVSLSVFILLVAFLVYQLANSSQDTRSQASPVDRVGAFTKPSYQNISGLYAMTDHGSYTGGLKSVNAPGGIFLGSHNRFAWRRLQPSPGRYDWSDIDSWLAELDRGGKKGVIGVMLRCEDGGSSKNDICAPGWVLGNAYRPVQVAAADVPSKCGFSTGDARLKRLNYTDVQVKDELSRFILAMGERYRDDARVASIEVDVGYWGEANPHPSSNVICDKEAQKKAYEASYSTAAWVSYTNWLVQQYAVAFNKQKPLAVVISGAFRSHDERGDRVKKILQLARQGHKMGLHHTGLEADFPLGARVDGQGAQYLPPGDKRAYQAQWVPLERNWPELFISFESNHWRSRNYNLPSYPNDQAYVWWSVLNALDKHANVYYVYSQNSNAADDTWNTANPRWEWKNLEAWQFFNKFAGKSQQNTQEAWIAFRTSMVDDESRAEFWYGDIYDYEFYIKHDLAAAGNSQLAHYAKQKEHGGSNLPWDLSQSDWRAAYNRQTDLAGGRPYLHLNIDDKFMANPTDPVTVSITYWDGNSALKGNQWLLEYDSNSSAQKATEPVILNGTGQWLTKTFTLDDARFLNRLNGNDLRLKATKGDTYFHMVKITKGGQGDCSINNQGPLDLEDYTRLVLNLFSSKKTDNYTQGDAADSGSSTDFNCDGQIDLRDYSTLVKNFSVL